jgi:hypothetical protein
MANEHSEENEEIAINAWEHAVFHSEKAKKIEKDLERLQTQVTRAIETEKIIACFWLTIGGYGEDAAAHRMLEIPFWTNKE